MDNRFGKTENKRIWYKNLLGGLKSFLKLDQVHNNRNSMFLKGKHNGARYVSYSSLIGEDDPHGMDGYVKICDDDRLEELLEEEILDDDVLEYEENDFDFSGDKGIDFKD